MPIILPPRPLPKSATPRPLDFGAWQTPAGGGTAQRLDRNGSRFAIDIVTPNLKPEPDGRIWVSRMVQGVNATVLYAFPQPGLRVGAPGSPIVAGAGQAGMFLAVRGFTPRYTVREGQFFSMITGGQRFLYMATAGVMADGGGLARVPIWPPLRRSPADGDVCEFARPMIEGALSGNEKGWTLVIARTQGLQLTVTEIE